MCEPCKQQRHAMCADVDQTKKIKVDKETGELLVFKLHVDYAGCPCQHKGSR